MVSITHEKHKFTQIRGRNNFYNKIICLGTETDNFSAIHFICAKCHSGAYFGPNNSEDECLANSRFRFRTPKFCPQILVLSELLLVNAELRN